MMTRRRRLLGVWLACALATASYARATVMVLLSVPELAARSDVIATGTVRSVRSRIVLEDDAARPYTFIEIAVERVERGPLREREVLVLQETGGAWVDETRAATVGNPIYQVGERVLVFAQHARHLVAGRYRTTAMAQGKYVLRAQPSGDVASRDLRGLSFATPRPFGGLSLQDGTLEPARLLSQLLREMQARRP